MTRNMKGKRSLPKLVCAKAKIGAGCPYVTVDMARVERTIMERYKEIQKALQPQMRLQAERWKMLNMP